MKSLFLSIVLSLSFSALAQTAPVELVGEEVSINAGEAVVARTANTTAKEVKIILTVPMEKRVCERSETRVVWRTSSIHCGEDIHYRSTSVKVCDERNPAGKCVRGHVQNRRTTVVVPRSCMVPETFCVQYGTAIVPERESMTLEFKKLPALAGSEADLFTVRGMQKSYDSDTVVFEVEVLESVVPLKVKREKRLFGKSNDDFVVSQK